MLVHEILIFKKWLLQKTVGHECFFFKIRDFFLYSALWKTVTFYVNVKGVPNLNSLLVKLQIDNPSPGAVTEGKLVPISSLIPV